MDEVQYGTKISWDYWSYRAKNSTVRYRMDPIPGTSKYRGNRYAWQRYPVTKQLLTLHDKSFKEDMHELTSQQQHQIKMRDRYIPHSYDDPPFARRGFSWKYYRKNQYRRIKMM